MKRIVIVIAALAVIVAVGAGIYRARITINDEERASACFKRLANTLERAVDPAQIFHRELTELQSLVEQSLVARSEMLVVANRLRVNDDVPLSSRDLVTLKSGTESYLDLREDLYNIANTYECAVDAEPELLQAFDIGEELRLKALMLSLGAALTLYDNYLLGVVHFEQEERLRRIVNDPDMGFGLVANKLAEATLAANSVEVRHRARRAIDFYAEHRALFADAHEDSDAAYLMQLIETSPSYNYVKKIRLGEIAGNTFQAFERIAFDRTAEGAAEGVDLLSGLFGNSVGLYESRKGKLYGDENALQEIRSRLQPLDILLEKTPFRLTDKLIPGHFGHVAIWTGSEAELVDAGVWDELIVEQYADALSSDHRIIEALRSGVQLSRLVCSELAYVSLPAFDWPTETVLGRHSISPDNVAQLAWNNVPLRLVMSYHDGERVRESQQTEKMRELMLN